MATDFNQIELNDQQRHLLANAAVNLGVPWPEVFEKAIAPVAGKHDRDEENGRPESPYRILLQHGLIGCIEGTPTDLSTNKKYLEGYGKNG
jgi:hypothetical protein